MSVVVPCIIDEHSHVTQLDPSFFDSGLQPGDVPNVAGDEEWRGSRLFLRLSDERPARLLRNIHKSHARSLPGERACEGRTNAASSAGKEDRFVSEPTVA